MSDKKNNQQDDETVELLHRALIEEEEIEISELSQDIQDLVAKFNDLETAYDENPTEKSFYELQELDATIADEIQTFIEDKNIDDEEEEDYDPNEDENKNNQTNQTKTQSQMKKTEEKNPEAEKAAADKAAAEKAAADKAAADKAEADNKAAADKAAAEKAAADKAAAEKAAADKAAADKAAEEEKNKPSPTEVLVGKIKAKLVDGRISNDDLSAILGVKKADELEYKLGNFTLRKVYLGDGAYMVK